MYKRQTYDFLYFTNPMSFGNAAMLKFLKKLAFTIIGGSGAAINLQWGYDYSQSFRSQQYALSGADVAEYNIAEYNEAEYSTGVITARPAINTGGSGYVVTIGVSATIDGEPLSIQQIDALALLGRLI